MGNSSASEYRLVYDEITHVTDANTFSLESLDDQHTYQMQQLYQLIFRLCFLDFNVSHNNSAFSGSLEPCILKYARQQATFVRDISRFSNNYSSHQSDNKKGEVGDTEIHQEHESSGEADAGDNPRTTATENLDIDSF